MYQSVEEPDLLMIQEQQVFTTIKVSQLINDELTLSSGWFFRIPTTVIVSCGSLESLRTSRVPPT